MQFDLENTFNPEEYLYFYSDLLTRERLEQELNFLVKFAHLDKPLKILDLACGHGRHANALAGMGHAVTGMDINPGFLELAKAEADKLHVKVDYQIHDMREIKDREIYDRVFVMFTAMGYYDDAQNEIVFQNIFNALKPGGLFCFDSHNRDTFLTYFLPTTVVSKEGNFLIDQRTYDTLTGCSRTKRSTIYKGTTKHFNFDVRLYSPTEITQLFKKIGFSKVDFYENWEGKPISQEAKRMIVIAQK